MSRPKYAAAEDVCPEHGPHTEDYCPGCTARRERNEMAVRGILFVCPISECDRGQYEGGISEGRISFEHGEAPFHRFFVECDTLAAEIAQVPASLARAIEYLGAVEVAPGRYAWRADGRYWVMSAVELTGTQPQEDETQFSERNGTPMPSWWTPEKRTTTRCKHGDGGGTCNDGVWEVTADLETGAEVPA